MLARKKIINLQDIFMIFNAPYILIPIVKDRDLKTNSNLQGWESLFALLTLSPRNDSDPVLYDAFHRCERQTSPSLPISHADGTRSLHSRCAFIKALVHFPLQLGPIPVFYVKHITHTGIHAHFSAKPFSAAVLPLNAHNKHVSVQCCLISEDHQSPEFREACLEAFLGLYPGGYFSVAAQRSIIT